VVYVLYCHKRVVALLSASGKGHIGSVQLELLEEAFQFLLQLLHVLGAVLRVQCQPFADHFDHRLHGLDHLIEEHHVRGIRRCVRGVEERLERWRENMGAESETRWRKGRARTTHTYTHTGREAQ
jgi:hypothetical protein